MEKQFKKSDLVKALLKSLLVGERKLLHTLKEAQSNFENVYYNDVDGYYLYEKESDTYVYAYPLIEAFLASLELSIFVDDLKIIA